MIYLVHQDKIVCQDGTRIEAEPMPDGSFSMYMIIPNSKGEFKFIISTDEEVRHAHDRIRHIAMRLSRAGHTIIRV